ncbi:MAG: stage V sporulation protein E [Planctomyces sp.]|nr:stage V sporulation protein E [Planctomyces sp.]
MLRPGHMVALSALALLTLGVVMVNSALMSVGTPGITPASVLASAPTVHMFMAMAAMGLAAWLSPRLLLRPLLALEWRQRGLPLPAAAHRGHARNGWGLLSLWVALGAVLGALAVVYIPGLGREVNGSARWIKLPLPGPLGVTAQPSEVAKWAMVPIVAAYAAAMGPAIRRPLSGLLPILAAVGLVCGVIVLEDLGTAVLIAGVAGFVLLAAGARWWHFAIASVPGLLGVVAAVIQNPYRLGRITTWLDPYQDPDGDGYHIIQSLVAVSHGGLSGRGLGHGLQKFAYLPEDDTDFLFAIIAEELGLAGALVVGSLYLAMLAAGSLIVRSQPSRALGLLGLGVMATVAFQALINMGVVTGLLPTKGIALPLLSSGGTGWILTAAMLGVLIATAGAPARAGVPRPRGPAPFTPTPTPAAPPPTSENPSPNAGAIARANAGPAPHAVALPPQPLPEPKLAPTAADLSARGTLWSLAPEPRA